MKRCQDCGKYKGDICQKYNKIPPVNFASKCRYYNGPKTTENKIQCKTCNYHFDDDIGEHCLRFDHSEYKLNFIKIRDHHSCPLGIF